MPAFAAIPAGPKVSRGRAEGEGAAIFIDVEGVAVDEVVAGLGRQTGGDPAEGLAAVLGLEDAELAVLGDAELVLLRRDEPGGLGTLRMGGDREAEGVGDRAPLGGAVGAPELGIV